MATFYQRRSQVPGSWSGGADHWWQGPGWYEGGLNEGLGQFPTLTQAPPASSATTPQELERTMDWSQTGQMQQTPLTYQVLKDAGMWDLADPNSQTWQWIEDRYGGERLGGVMTPRSQALALSLFDLKIPQSEYATAFQGLTPQQMQELSSEVSAKQERMVDAAKDQDWTEKYLEPLVNPITLGALAFGYLPGLAEAGSIGSGSVLSGEAANTGGGMWDWLDSLLGETGEFGVDPSLLESGFNASGSGFGAAGLSSPSWLDDLLKETGEFGMDPGMLEGGFNPAGSGFNVGSGFFDPLKRLGSNALKSLTGSDNASGGGTSAGKNILDTIFGDPLQAAFNATPFLLALTEANRQGDDLDDVIGKINGEAYTKSVLNPYDLDTGLGRTAMLEDQQRRGIRGSSFGRNDITNYDYMRSLGRGDLFNRANLASAQLEGNLINTRNTNRNLLLGAGLNASGRLFEPVQKDPFGLNRLLGLP